MTTSATPISCEISSRATTSTSVSGLQPREVNTLLRKLMRYSEVSLGNLRSLLGGSSGPTVANGVVEAVRGANTVWPDSATRARIRRATFALAYGNQIQENVIQWLHNAFEWPIRCIRPEEKVIDIWSE